MNRVANRIYLDGTKRKLKGNVHTHSTRSDGQYSPEEVANAYKNKGYHFICLSDHEVYYHSTKLDSEQFIVISGYEMACEMSREETGQQYHVHGLLDPALQAAQPFAHDEEHIKPNYESLSTIQSMIDHMIDRGNWIIMNHPEWSKNKPEDLLALQNYSAIEIYNHQSELEEATGFGVAYWDYLLRNGRQVLAIASDDAHGGDYHAPISEFFGGWVEVEADELNQQSIMTALKEGRYYSSSGPAIYDLRIEDGQLKVICSDVFMIKFITYPQNGKSVFNSDGTPVNSGAYAIRGKERYIRIECVDYQGRVAWSNAIMNVQDNE